MAASYKKLVEGFKADADKAAVGLDAAIRAREMRPTEFDELGKLFVECFGYHEYVACKEGKQLAHDVFKRFSEDDAGVTTAAFQNISGQIVYAALLEGYENEEYVFAKMIPEKKPTILGGEKIAGITDLGDVSALRKEGDAYQEAGVGEDWIYSPPVLDYGRIVSLTWESIFEDRTGMLVDQCSKVGDWIGYGEEVQAIDAFIDENVTAHRYNWRSAGQIATYGDNSGSHSWDNLAASNTLVDWTNINAAEQVFNGLTNPYTGTPINISPTHIVVTKQLEQTANRIIHATEIRVATPGYAVSGNPTQTNQANPYLKKYEVLSSKLLAARLGTDTSWFLANPKKLMKRMVAEPLTQVEAPSGTQLEFERRVVRRFRATKRYCHFVEQPRAAVKSTAG